MYHPFVIALIAHDAKKHELAKWAQEQHAWLMGKRLVATRSTARVVTDSTGLPVESVESGPLGGDQQIGALVSAGQVTCLVFFWDPLGVHPHAHDVYALLRLATLYNIPTATNPATAHALADSQALADAAARAIGVPVAAAEKPTPSRQYAVFHRCPLMKHAARRRLSWDFRVSRVAARTSSAETPSA